MQSYQHHPIINQVESVLISTKQPSKTFNSQGSLIQSKHTTDSNQRLFCQPSKRSVAQILKISPIQAHSLQMNANSNIKAFIYVSLVNAIDGRDDNFYQYFIQQIENKNINLDCVKEHPYIKEQGQMIIRGILGFIKTLKIKKATNKQLKWENELENTPMIMDYLVIFCRAILSKLGQAASDNYFKQLSTRTVIQKLSEYFDLNYIEKEKYFLFEQTEVFIYQFENQILFGKFGKIQEDNKIEQNPQINRIQKKYNNYNLKILENSTQSLASNLIQSRHNQERTPFFNVVTQQQKKFNFDSNKPNQSIQGEDFSHLFLSNGSKKECYFNNQGGHLQNSKPDSITSSAGFRINVFSQQKNLCQKTKYHKDKKDQDTINEPTNNFKENKNQEPNFKHFQQNKKLLTQNNKQRQPFYENKKKLQSQTKSFNQIVKMTKAPQKKVFFAAKKYSQEDFTVKQFDKFKAFKKKSQNCNSQQAFKRANTEEFDIKTRNFHKDGKNWPIIFDWQNEQRRLMRVQSVSYKTCGTCHRRFYRNEITSQVFQVTFKPAIQNLNPVKSQKSNKTIQRSQKRVQFKQPSKLNNPKHHKKSADTVILQNLNKTNNKISNCKSLKWLQNLEIKKSVNSFNVKSQPRVSIQQKIKTQQELKKQKNNHFILKKVNSKQNVSIGPNNSISPLNKLNERQSNGIIQKKPFQPYQVKKLDQILSFKSPKYQDKDKNKNKDQPKFSISNQNRISKSPDYKLAFGHLQSGISQKKFQKIDFKRQKAG